MAQPTVEDRVLIRELYDRMVWALNTGDADTIRTLHAPDAQTERWNGATGGVEGPVAASAESLNDPVGRTRQHHITSFIVDPDADGHDDRMAVRFYFMVTQVSDPPENVIRWSCFSRDTVMRIDGAWRIWRRNIKLNDDRTA
jgi:hypothetical protein